jgi:hypothetical protein
MYHLATLFQKQVKVSVCVETASSSGQKLWWSIFNKQQKNGFSVEVSFNCGMLFSLMS